MNDKAQIQKVIMLPVPMIVPGLEGLTSADGTAEFADIQNGDVKPQAMCLMVQIDI